MLNPFPELLALSFFAPLFLRVALGLVLFLTSFHQLIDKREELSKRFNAVWPQYGTKIVWTTGIIEVVVGLSFIAGFYTQIAALIGILFSGFVIFSKKYKKVMHRDISFYILMFAISLSLLVTGAGIFAFDLPL